MNSETFSENWAERAEGKDMTVVHDRFSCCILTRTWAYSDIFMRGAGRRNYSGNCPGQHFRPHIRRLCTKKKEHVREQPVQLTSLHFPHSGDSLFMTDHRVRSLTLEATLVCLISADDSNQP